LGENARFWENLALQILGKLIAAEIVTIHQFNPNIEPNYRHEGRKMKQELRCHAVLCPSENKAKKMCKKLQERLHQVPTFYHDQPTCV